MKIKTSACPIEKVATILSDKWTMLIVRDLVKTSMRYKELVASLRGISTRTLTLKLKKLEGCGIISKKELYYYVTPKGKKLGAIYLEMTKYGERYL